MEVGLVSKTIYFNCVYRREFIVIFDYNLSDDSVLYQTNNLFAYFHPLKNCFIEGEKKKLNRNTKMQIFIQIQ